MQSQTVYSPLKAADIVFRPIGKEAEELVRKELARTYVKNEEGYIIDIDDVITVYADSEQTKLYAVMALLDSWEDGLKKALTRHYPVVAHLLMVAEIYTVRKR